MVWSGVYTGASVTTGDWTEYASDVYGDATIGWVPPVTNYNYPDNVMKRGPSDGTFTWEEVQIELENVTSGALIEFLMPDSYLVQMTPDLGWQDKLAMFGDNNDLGLQNPHLKSAGPFSISDGTLTDNGDGSVTLNLSSSDFLNIATKGFEKHYWRAIPFADGNPGLGGFPTKFLYVSDRTQLDFTVDNIIKETKRAVQTITGKKGNRVTISIENEDNPTIFIEQSNTDWKISFSIDRPKVSFRIVATDSGGGIVGYHKVDISYEAFSQFSGHVWNSFDGFALLVGLTRLPGETNAQLKARITDAYQNKPGSNFSGLVSSINRELGFDRLDTGLVLERSQNKYNLALNNFIEIYTTQTRLCLYAPSFVKEEIVLVDEYDNILNTQKRIYEVLSIKTERDSEIKNYSWNLIEDETGRKIKMHSPGTYKIEYRYKEDLDFATYPTVSDIKSAINNLTSPSNEKVISASLSKEMSGSERSDRLYLGYGLINSENPSLEIGWSIISLKSVADEEWKRSFEDAKGAYFNSKFYHYAKELKMQTNVEWGSVVADEDVWDAVGEQYGSAFLPMIYDQCISDWRLPVEIYGKLSFDPWDAFRKNYYYGGKTIKNLGLDKRLFVSGVGFTKDCMTSVKMINLTPDDGKINLNPHISKSESFIDLNEDLINSIKLDI